MPATRTSIHLRELAGLAPEAVPRVLLVAEDPVFSQLLRRHIEPLPAAVHEVGGEGGGHTVPDVVVISFSQSLDARIAAQIIAQARAQSPAAAIITVSLPEHTPDSELLLSLGVSEHLDRKSSHPRDIATAVSRVMST